MRRVVEKNKKNNKKIIIIAIVVILVIAIAILGVYVFRKSAGNSSHSEENVAVQSVEILSGNIDNAETKFSGMIISQKTVKVPKQSGKTIKKVYVEVGQEVKTGEKLFEYDTDDINIKIEEANLEVEKLQNSISDSRKQIDNINAEIAANPGVDPASQRVEIQTLENGIKQSEFNIKSKSNEISRLKKSLQNVVIKAEIDGIIQNISEIDDQQGENSYNYTSNSNQSDSFITIMQTGQYKVKGVVNEQNVFTINSGDKVIVRSRVDDTKTWTGTIENIDTSNTEKEENEFSSNNSEENMNKSSKYPFYVNLDSMEGLMLGQHVYIERDLGQTEVKEGLWLSDYFIVEENGEYYVWAANSKDKLEKRKIEVGDKDEKLGKYQITKGLTEEDYIAVPDEGLVEGIGVDKFDSIEIPQDMGGDLDETMDSLENAEGQQEPTTNENGATDGDDNSAANNDVKTN